MTTEYRALVCQMLESQAYREMMAANLLGHSLKHVPDLHNKKSVAHDLIEELEHYESTVDLYRELTGGDIGDVIGPKLARVPYPESWMELAMAQFLYDRAGEFHLREYRSCSYAPYAKAVTKILEEEEEHEGFGETVIRQFCSDAANRPAAQKLLDKWLPVALLSFGRPGTDGNRKAIEMGLKTRDSGEVMQAFLDDIKPTMRQCGLRFPKAAEMGIEFAKGVDLSL
ncbi:MAG TPA: ferritin-like fold-containing protein [Patescibacteria group bacterium]|jgi:ring-1,2-phenylacetyl-CoA epoxidase subunit PaaA|nr:ferritin-like fold-containing protein [Patescibacteria group bacterium]